MTTVLIQILALVYGIFFLNENNQMEEEDQCEKTNEFEISKIRKCILLKKMNVTKEKRFYSDLFELRFPKEVLMALFRKREDWKRAILLIILSIFTLFKIIDIGPTSSIYNFDEYNFHQENREYRSYIDIICLIVITSLLTLLIRFFQKLEFILLAVCTSSLFVFVHIILHFVGEDYEDILLFVTSILYFTVPLIFSIASKIVCAREIGVLFTVFMILEKVAVFKSYTGVQLTSYDSEDVDESINLMFFFIILILSM